MKNNEEAHLMFLLNLEKDTYNIKKKGGESLLVFKKRKTRNKIEKELLDYQDGEVVSVGIIKKKQTEKKENFNDEEKEKFMSKKNLLNLTTYKKGIKIAVWTSVFFLASLILVDVFALLKESEQPNSITEKPINQEQFQDQGIYKSPVSETTENNLLPSESSKLTWEDLIQVTEKVNYLLTQQTNLDLQNLYAYKRREFSRLTLESKLQKSVENKKTIYQNYLSLERQFEKAGLIKLFLQTTTRAEESLLFTDTIIKAVIYYDNQFESVKLDYIQKDSVFADKQEEIIKEFLMEKKIPFTVNEESDEILF